MTGNTKELAFKMKDVIERNGHICDIHRDNKLKNHVRGNKDFFSQYDLICLGSCTHGWAPAFSFGMFLNSIKKHEFENQMFVCFATSASPTAWEGTCKNIKKRFPKLNHIGNFGCSLRNNKETIKQFDNLIKNLN